MSNADHENTFPGSFERDLVQSRTSIRRFILAKVSDHQAVDDLVQETLLRTLRSADRSKVGNASAYAVQVAKTVIVDHWHRERRDPSVEEPPVEQAADTPSPEDVQSQAQRFADLQQILAAMPPQRREAFVRRRLHDQSREEIARAMDLSVEAVKKHISRAIVDVTAAMTARGWND
ncbi:MAG: sigma-70 family RNA polymerase sigma factor [Solimonas sp.]